MSTATLRRFRIRKGKHWVNGEDGAPRCYVAGDPSCNIIETSLDLVKRFGGEKFEEVGGDNVAKPAPSKEPTTPKTIDQLRGEVSTRQANRDKDEDTGEKEEGDEFDDMTVAQLIDHAQANEVDLQGATRRADILKIIRGE